jgi:glucose-6-phosphate dehydrogenase assembly protein OpcA
MAALQEHVDRTIRMASLAKDPVAHVARMLQSAHPTLDLSWFRMAPVREQIAAFFDDPDTGFDLRAVTAVRLFLPTEGRVLSSLLEGQIIGWLGAHLEWKQQAEPTANEALFTRQGEIIRVTGEASDHAALQLEARSGATFSVQLEASSITMSCSEKGGCALTERGLRFGLLGLEAALGLALNTPSRARHFREAAVVALPILTHLRLRGLC